MPHNISENEVTVLGFTAAGWKNLIDQEKRLGHKIYSFGTTPVKENDSYYGIGHPLTTPMTQGKKDFIRTVSAQEFLSNADSTLKKEQKNKLIELYNIAAEASALQKISPDTLQTGETLTNRLANNRPPITPHTFFHAIGHAAYVDKDIVPDPKHYLKSLKSVLDDMVKTHRYSRQRLMEISTDNFSSLQGDMWSSKQVITDTFQENLRRHYAGEPLIPIRIAISTDAFNPNVQEIAGKSNAFFTATEIRMLYKLMNEINDPAAKQVMEDSVFFLKQNSDGSFVKTAAPWESRSFLDQRTWLERPRGQRNQALGPYATRATMPPWINNILSNRGEGPETKTRLEQKESAQKEETPTKGL